MRWSGSSLTRVLMLYVGLPLMMMGAGRLMFRSAGYLTPRFNMYIVLIERSGATWRSIVSCACWLYAVGKSGSAVVIDCGGKLASGMGAGLVHTWLPSPDGGGTFGNAPAGKPKFWPRKRAAASVPTSVRVFTVSPLN